MAKKISVKDVRTLAEENYDKGADFIVECMDDVEIQKYIDEEGLTSKKKWLAYIKEYNSTQCERAASAGFFEAEPEPAEPVMEVEPVATEPVDVETDEPVQEPEFVRTWYIIRKRELGDTVVDIVTGDFRPALKAVEPKEFVTLISKEKAIAIANGDRVTTAGTIRVMEEAGIEDVLSTVQGLAGM